MLPRAGVVDQLTDVVFRIAAVISHPCTSRWLKDALSRALDRDPLDAVDDAEALLDLLGGRTQAIFGRAFAGPATPASQGF